MNQQSANGLKSDMPDDILQQAVASLQAETVPAGPPSQLVAATLHTLHESEQRTSSIPFVSRTKIMKLTATAAALLFLASVATWLIPGIKTQSSAFGDALKQVRDARLMSFSQLQTVAGKQEPIRTKNFVTEDGRRRIEMSSKGASDKVTTIFDSHGDIRLLLSELTKTAFVQDARGDRGINAGKMFLTWLQDLKKLNDKPDKELGHKDLDGKRVTGFEATQGNFKFTMWIDDATQELVRMEYDSPVNGADQHITMTDFRFNENLDESLFSFEVPAGYKVQKMHKQSAVSAVPGGESSIVEALRAYTKRDGGKFPASLSDWGPWVVLFSKDSHDGALDPETIRVMSHLGSILPFLVSMPKDDYAYLGKGKILDQKDTIVFWFKKPNGKYRAIFADLTTKDITAENLPKN